MSRSLVLSVVASLLFTAAASADVQSGPAVGSEVPALTVFGVTGDVQNEEVDFVAQRDGKPTIYCFVPADKFTRPTGRLLKALDGRIDDVDADAAIVTVWLTEDAEASKEYMPILQQSMQFENTSLTVCTSDPLGPLEWAVNLSADITVIVAQDGVVKKTFGFVSANDTVTDSVIEAFE